MEEATVEELDRKLRPILKKMSVLQPSNYGYPTLRQFMFNWLVDLTHTVEEFNYVIGPLVQNVYDDMDTYIPHSGRHIYLGLAAAEALAVRKPVLQGAWKDAAWRVIRLNRNFPNRYNYGTTSNHLREWIIDMIGNHNLCPCPYLRVGFLNMFCSMASVTEHNWKHALESIIFTCSALNKDHLKKIVNSEVHNVNLYSIIRAVQKFIKGGYLLRFDQQLSNKLHSQISILLHGVPCFNHLNLNKSTLSHEIDIVASLFQTIAGYARQEHKMFKENPIQQSNIYLVVRALTVLLTNFRMSCRTPPLVNVTALSIMEVVELVLMVNISLLNDQNEILLLSLKDTNELLGVIVDNKDGENAVVSPVGQAIYCMHQGRLSNLKQQIMQNGLLNIDRYVMICNLLYNYTFDT